MDTKKSISKFEEYALFLKDQSNQRLDDLLQRVCIQTIQYYDKSEL
jgi:hypothetical protein